MEKSMEISANLPEGQETKIKQEQGKSRKSSKSYESKVLVEVLNALQNNGKGYSFHEDYLKKSQINRKFPPDDVDSGESILITLFLFLLCRWN